MAGQNVHEFAQQSRRTVLKMSWNPYTVNACGLKFFANKHVWLIQICGNDDLGL